MVPSPPFDARFRCRGADVSLVSVALAWLPIAWAGLISGLAYGMIGPAAAVHGRRRARGRPDA